MGVVRTPLITKSDGSKEPLHAAKLRRCVTRVLGDGGLDRHMADPLTKAVNVHIQHSRHALPTSEYVYQCVLAALSQTGLGKAALLLESHREQRRRARRRVAVYDAARPIRPAAWSKSRLVASLKSGYGLGHSVARQLGGLIETKVLGMGFRFVSSELVAAIVRNELQAWGLLGELAEDSVEFFAQQAAWTRQKGDDAG